MVSQKRDFLSLLDFSSEELSAIIDRAIALKRKKLQLSSFDFWIPGMSLREFEQQGKETPLCRVPLYLLQTIDQRFL